MIAAAETEDILDVLRTFKTLRVDDPNALFWFQSSPSFQKMILAWPSVPIKMIGGAGKQPREERELWAWLWKNYALDNEEWLKLAGIVDLRYGLRLIERIIKLQLVFPDGTYPTWLMRFLRVRALGMTQRVAPRQAPPAKSKEKKKVKKKLKKKPKEE